MKKQTLFILICGLAVGLAAIALTLLGNPANMGFCIACFERDIAGALGFHAADKVQYLRPEIGGLVLGAFIISLIMGEFKPKAGSSPATRFLLGACVMIGALVFLGCPLRMVIRLAGGDLNALTALVGFFVGILVGVIFLKRGFTLGRAYNSTRTEGAALPTVMVLLLCALFFVPSLLKFSEAGPGSKHAEAWIALAIALVIGALAQRTRLCMVGGLRDVILFRDLHLILGFIGVFAAIVVGNLALGSFKLGFVSQPVAHSAHLWNFLGMFIVGWGSVLLGGCPLRQLILAGEGSGDAAVTVFGMMAGAALSHNLKLAGSADSVNEAGEYIVGGIGTNGKIAVGIIIVLLLAVSLINSKKEAK